MTENLKFVIAMFRLTPQTINNYELAKSFLNKQDREYFMARVKREEGGRYFWI